MKREKRYELRYIGVGSTYVRTFFTYEAAAMHAALLLGDCVRKMNVWELNTNGWTYAENSAGVRAYVYDMEK